MARDDQFDHSNFGLFEGSPALDNINELDEQQSPDYYAMTRPCEGCGIMKQLQIPWSELYCLQYAIDPAEVGRQMRREDLFNTSWVFHPRHHCFHPNYRCGCMGNPLVMFNMTPVQAEKKIKEASRNGVLSDEQTNIIRTISQLVQHMAKIKAGMPVSQPQYQQQRSQGQPMQGYPQQMPGMPPPGMRRR
jgi:hypothetical protein